ncbi:CDK-activating kinase assembly factor MAT1 [Diplodia seriata]|uniref:CDK-activating kinase assembly factor MAT1 n=1 Tax=Diplodia seriata TaxID=420778 RepID=A0ABR3CVL6_9PEZI
MAEELFFVIGTFEKASLGTKCPRCRAEYCDYPGVNIPISLVECGHVLCFSCIDAIYLRQLRAPPYRCCYSDCGTAFSPYWGNSNKLLALDAEYERYDGPLDKSKQINCDP